MERVQRRRGRPSEGARDAVIEAARELFMERDFGAVSTEAILERSGVSRGALYHHFPSKIDLFKAVWEASERRAIERIGSEAMAADSPFDALIVAARAYLREAETNDELRRIGLTQSRAVLGWAGWREAAGELGVGVVLAMVTAAMESGQLPRRDPEATAHVLLGALIEAAMLIVVAQDPASARERSEAVVLDLLEGLRR